MTEKDPARYGLRIPFVVVRSNGGPYDDCSFVAGCQFGQIYEELTRVPKVDVLSRYVYPGLVRQLDLAAMDCGYSMTLEPWEEHPDEWVFATFRLLPDDR